MSNYTTSRVISQDKHNDRLVCATIQVMSVCVCARRIEFPVSIPKSFPTWSTVFSPPELFQLLPVYSQPRLPPTGDSAPGASQDSSPLSTSLPPVCARIYTPTRNPMAQCRRWAATASHSRTTVPDRFRAFQVFPILVLEALSDKFLTEGPTCKCIAKLGHCISVLSSQNCHLLYNLSPKHDYFSSPF